MEDLQLVKEILINAGQTAGYKITDNLDKIAKLKLRFFGVGDCLKCCCNRDGKHSCISEACRKDIKNNGVCCCHLFEEV